MPCSCKIKTSEKIVILNTSNIFRETWHENNDNISGYGKQKVCIRSIRPYDFPASTQAS